ncbi:7474_t:CDS:2 [Entrophospora sp. SA101]|nr:7474_t:CDS:2 [Entrophospora sp. SA101]
MSIILVYDIIKAKSLQGNTTLDACARSLLWSDDILQRVVLGNPKNIVFSLLLGLGVEIGCFVAGVFIHNCRYIIDSSIGVVEPVKDLFSCLFFASIGLHIYPSFLINEAPLLLILTAGAVGFKFINSSLALAILGHPIQRASTMAVGLAQISEFAFVLGSRAKGYGIISREAYYLLLTTTSLTLVVTPILWNILFNKKKDFNSSIGGGNTGGVIPFSINNPGKVE